jgi:hypothetical protein
MRTFESFSNAADRKFVPIPLRLPEELVCQIDAAMDHLHIRSRAEFAAFSVLYALASLSSDSATIWMGNDEFGGETGE